MKNVPENLKLAIRSAELVERVALIVARDKVKYSEAIIEICNELGIEAEDIAGIIPAPLKEKLRNEAMDFHQLPDSRGNRLHGLT
jgi:hypothetical protein